MESAMVAEKAFGMAVWMVEKRVASKVVSTATMMVLYSDF